ncbi:nucleotide-binding protein [Chthonobacter rhizosphaerae]|uniref:nucleotide-binding protein n=1 Tax=Chthonobacter rhizosphaerae TaxID=2735553 RepID=UPI0015EE3A53|nr:nucleotide-binding protein [Chthonobacter rhizosphaerae]
MTEHRRIAAAIEPLLDRFEGTVPPGRLGGGRPDDVWGRHVVDVEGVIGIDHGALRIQPLATPGWGRAGASYGPFEAGDGLVLAALVLNGHNTSQAGDLHQHLARRLWQWAKGNGSEPLAGRLASWLRHPRKRLLLDHLRRWVPLHRRRRHGAPALDENFAIGWYRTPAPADPTTEGFGLVMHATGYENGQLRASSGGRMPPVLHGVQNVPIHYAVLVRRWGVVHLAAAGLDRVPGLPTYPRFRPLLVDPRPAAGPFHAGLHQSVLGQIGFRVDTRVHGVEIRTVGAWDRWYGTASVADLFAGEGPLRGTAAEIGGAWATVTDGLQRSPEGLRATGAGEATLRAGQPPGLLLVVVAGEPGRVELRFRVAGDGDGWSVSLDEARCALSVRSAGRVEEIAAEDVGPGDGDRALQVSDDGAEIAVFLDGRRLFGRCIRDGRLSAEAGLGLALAGAVTVRRLEAHPRAIDATGLLHLPRLPTPTAEREILRDDFDGPAGDLDGRTTANGATRWRRAAGRGVIAATGDGAARVDADRARPNPGRTIYTVDWESPNLADLEVDITPPGSRRGDGHGGRAGLVFWQDAGNHLTINNWLSDGYGGASISSFLTLDGFEDLYDAVWTNVGARIHWGRRHRLRAAFDGMVYTVHVDGEPVLYRSLRDIHRDARRLAIRRVGLVANWEWGDDTGSRFHRFIARSGGGA